MFRNEFQQLRSLEWIQSHVIDELVRNKSGRAHSSTSILLIRIVVSQLGTSKTAIRSQATDS
jgi:hypothetical protein